VDSTSSLEKAPSLADRFPASTLFFSASFRKLSGSLKEPVFKKTLDRRGHPGEFRMSDDLALNEKIKAAEG
jgi:hypothetical protein